MLQRCGGQFSDRDIHDICEATAYYAYVNRIADGLGVKVEDWYPPDPPDGHWPGEDGEEGSMRFFTDADIEAALESLIDSIEQIMVDPSATAPARTFHTVPDGNGNGRPFFSNQVGSPARSSV